VLLQLAHPLVLQGVLDHSMFVAEPSRRLERASETNESVLLLAFGPPDEIKATAAQVNGIHDRVHGPAARDAGRLRSGARYRAPHPELLRWARAEGIQPPG